MTSGSASSGANGPAPTRSSRTRSAIRSMAVSPSTAAVGSARTAETIAAAVTGVVAAAIRCRTRAASVPSSGRPVMPHP